MQDMLILVSTFNQTEFFFKKGIIIGFSTVDSHLAYISFTFLKSFKSANLHAQQKLVSSATETVY